MTVKRVKVVSFGEIEYRFWDSSLERKLEMIFHNQVTIMENQQVLLEEIQKKEEGGEAIDEIP